MTAKKLNLNTAQEVRKCNNRFCYNETGANIFWGLAFVGTLVLILLFSMGKVG